MRNGIGVTVVLGVMAVLGIAGRAGAADDAAAVDLLAYDWSHLDGAVVAADGVRVSGLGRAIVPPADMADTPPTANPPINLRGPVLTLAGDFALTARLRLGTDGPPQARLTLYGRLPVIQDEWRQPGEAVTLAVKGDMLRLVVQHVSGERETYTQAWRPADSVTLALVRRGERLTLSANGEPMIAMPAPPVLASKRLWPGLDTDVGHTFTLESLRLRPLGEAARVAVTPATLVSTPPAPGGLRALAARNAPHLAIGTAVATNPLLGDPAYARVLAREFSMVTPENAMKFQFIHPRPGRYAFAEADAIVDFAEHNGMAVHGHTLAWGEALPRWLSRGDYSDGELREILADHIATVVGRYKGRVAGWDVVNEPLEPFGPELRRDSPWYRAMGADYIAFALRAAHRADPDAALYINEFACEERNAKSDALYRLARGLLADGVPLDGIGFQLHEDLTDDYRPVTAAAFRDNVRRFIDLGLAVRISEMDVNLHDDASTARLQQQAAYYASMLALARDIPAFTAFSTWGFTDRYSSLQDWWNPDGLGNGLIFDPALRAKPAYDALRRVLAR
ncbi:endo-1,4-beta-xylanase [Modicisalibacter sp. 'Wilcox']|uniref:endo-1,4-beta-xylanase n=1 Tax=Modicisalibacter sp. 'Wilcox' TaxID=2679914 RepID=UPI0013D5036A|nr:endo-1,4-beta-xylanase [Modicisalibacter sp. 'Wilcox']